MYNVVFINPIDDLYCMLICNKFYQKLDNKTAVKQLFSRVLEIYVTLMFMYTHKIELKYFL